MANYNFNDPDFDPPKNGTQPVDTVTFFALLGNKNAFIVGVVGAVLIMCTIGFFVLLAWMLIGR